MTTIKHKRGDVREDGKVFWAYDRSAKVQERWLSRDQFSKRVKSEKSYRAKNVERISKYQAEYREREKLRLQSYFRQYHANNKEKRSIQKKESRKKFGDRERARKNEWAKNNHGRVIATVRTRKLLLKGLADELAPLDKKLLTTFYVCCHRVSKCTGLKFHVDHIIPLAKGGAHHPSNLQILPEKLNLRKGAKIIYPL